MNLIAVQKETGNFEYLLNSFENLLNIKSKITGFR